MRDAIRTPSTRLRPHEDASVRKQRLDETGHKVGRAATRTGYGRIGYFNPYTYLLLPFAVRSTVLPQLLLLMALSAAIGYGAHCYNLSVDGLFHQLLGRCAAARSSICTRVYYFV